MVDLTPEGKLPCYFLLLIIIMMIELRASTKLKIQPAHARFNFEKLHYETKMILNFQAIKV